MSFKCLHETRNHTCLPWNSNYQTWHHLLNDAFKISSSHDVRVTFHCLKLCTTQAFIACIRSNIYALWLYFCCCYTVMLGGIVSRAHLLTSNILISLVVVLDMNCCGVVAALRATYLPLERNFSDSHHVFPSLVLTLFSKFCLKQITSFCYLNGRVLLFIIFIIGRNFLLHTDYQYVHRYLSCWKKGVLWFILDSLASVLQHGCGKNSFLTSNLLYL